MRRLRIAFVFLCLIATACSGGVSTSPPGAPAATPVAGASASSPGTSPSASGATAAPSSAASKNPSSTATPTASPTAAAGLPLSDLITTTATSADAFVSSMGVDVDLVSPPQSEQAEIASDFAALGVRQTRIAITEPNATAYKANVASFFQTNPSVSAFGLTDCAPPLGASSDDDITAADVTSFINSTGAKLDYIEGVNEPDNRGDDTWPVDTRTCLLPLTNGVDGVPLLAPSLITKLDGTDEDSLGTLSGEVEATNIHRYFNGYNPGTAGYGSSDSCGSYGALTWSICWGKYNDTSVPTIVTETGWNSTTEVDELTQAKYIERVFFVNAQAGIAKTSVYTLLSYTGGDSFGGDGLLRTDFSAKPAYTAISGITKLLSDPGSSITPSPLPLLITPTAATSGSGLRMMLLGKRDGSYQLALWQEVLSALPSTYGSDNPPSTITATVVTGKIFTGTIDAWQDDGTTTSTSTGGANLIFSVPVTDRLTILNLVPST